MIWRDEKYLRLLSPQLDRFRQQRDHTFNFRCPFCGDSQRNRAKARGYMFPKGAILMFKCQNCALALPFAAVLRRLAPALYDEYMVEEYRENAPPSEPPVVVSKPVPKTTNWMLVEPLMTTQHQTVVEYVRGRKLPETAFRRLYATDHAQTWLRPLVGTDKAQKVVDGVPYLVLPLRLPDGTWYGAQVRPVHRKEYITFRWEYESLKVFGMDVWSSSQTTYIVEGPLDALCLPNALAACGADLIGAVRSLEDAGLLRATEPRVYIWDNEPHNRDVVRHMRDAVVISQPIVIWRREYPKDLNEMLAAGLDVLSIVRTRTFTGLMAQMEMNSWLTPHRTTMGF